jgi:hypothetical protein
MTVFVERCIWYNCMWWSLLVTYWRSKGFTGYSDSDFLHYKTDHHDILVAEIFFKWCRVVNTNDEYWTHPDRQISQVNSDESWTQMMSTGLTQTGKYLKLIVMSREHKWWVLFFGGIVPTLWYFLEELFRHCDIFCFSFYYKRLRYLPVWMSPVLIICVHDSSLLNSKIQSQNHSKWQNQYPNTQMHECSLIIKIEHYNSYEGWIQLAKYFLKMVFNTDTDLTIYFLYLYSGPLWSW